MVLRKALCFGYNVKNNAIFSESYMWDGILMLIYVVLFVLSWGLTWRLRSHALKKEILDIPNHRSSHTLPTPQGGGLVFVGCFLSFLIVLRMQHVIEILFFISFMSAGLMVAVLGFLDDRYGMPSYWRLLGHFIAAAIMIYGVQGLTVLTLFSWTMTAGTMLNVLTLFYLVWLLNLYNFMDGIDGIAGVELISVCLGAIALYWVSGHAELILLPLLLLIPVAGFLCWNFPSARIFMGDVGSGFLGLMLGAFSIQAARVDEHFFWSWLILLGVFIVDATFTLFRRLFRGCKIYEAHRTHAYQHAAQQRGKHYPVVFGVLFINILWLFPLAMLVGLGYLPHMEGLLLAYLPLIILPIKFKAGAVST